MFYRDVKINNPVDYKKFVREYLPKDAKFIKDRRYVTLDNKYVSITLRRKI